MRSGYPRFFIHPLIDELSQKIVSSFSEGDNDASAGRCRKCGKLPDRSGATPLGMLFPSVRYARQCEVFLKAGAGVREGEIKTVALGLPSPEPTERQSERHVDWAGLPLHAVIYTSDLFPLAKSFWQHTGFGISSRYAELYLKHLDEIVVNRGSSCGVCSDHKIPLSLVQHEKQQRERIEAPAADISSYDKDDQIKGILRSRIADQYSTSTQIGCEDVYLFPTGMSAFANVVNALKAVRSDGAWSEIVCYG
jgi:cystathionine gamma-synthase